MNQRGYVLTNYHVIADADQIIVALQDGRVFSAELVGTDQLTDLAVLYIESDNLPVIPQDPERLPEVGDVVLAIGNPYNVGQTITQGIISATGRTGLSSMGPDSNGRQDLLQTDAAINEGNSGGAGQRPWRPGGHQHRHLPPQRQPGELRHQLRHPLPAGKTDHG